MEVKRLEKTRVNKEDKLANIFYKMGKPKSKIQIPNDIVRNNGYNLNAIDFTLIFYLKHYLFKNNNNEYLKVDHRILMSNVAVSENRTFKKSLLKLYEQGIIKNKIEKLPRKNVLELCIDKNKITNNREFTQLPKRVGDYLDIIDHKGLRLLYFYKSFINNNKPGREYAFPGYKEITNSLNMSDKTVTYYNNLLAVHGLIRIQSHKLGTDYRYNQNDAIIFDKYQNHYYVEGC